LYVSGFSGYGCVSSNLTTNLSTTFLFAFKLAASVERKKFIFLLWKNVVSIASVIVNHPPNFVSWLHKQVFQQLWLVIKSLFLHTLMMFCLSISGSRIFVELIWLELCWLVRDKILPILIFFIKSKFKILFKKNQTSYQQMPFKWLFDKNMLQLKMHFMMSIKLPIFEFEIWNDSLLSSNLDKKVTWKIITKSMKLQIAALLSCYLKWDKMFISQIKTCFSLLV